MFKFNGNLKWALFITALFNSLICTIYGNIVVDFVEQTSEDWIKDLHNYISDNIDKPKNITTNGTFTKEVAHCRSTCNSDVGNGVINFDEKCKTQPVLIYDRQVSPELLSGMSYAEATMPCFLKLSESKIPNAGDGVHTTNYKLPKGFVFGPYTGVIRKVTGVEGQQARDAGYAWRIRPNAYKMTLLYNLLDIFPYVNNFEVDDADFYIDGVSDENSNWLRYVNTARYEEEQNVFPLLFNDTVYYYLHKDIEPETELLTWYGYKYAKWLKIYVMSDSTHDWDTDYAPPINETICSSCPITDGDIRQEEEDDEEEEEVNCRGEPILGDIVIDDPDFVPDMRRMDGTPIGDNEDYNDDDNDYEIEQRTENKIPLPDDNSQSEINSNAHVEL